MEDILINAKNVHKLFDSEGIETLALREVDFRVKEGEFVSIMGPSGCGKSTLLYILGLLESPTEGEYFFMNKDVSLLTEKQRTLMRRGNIGVVFQNFNLIEELDVFENVRLPLLYIGKSSRSQRILVEQTLKDLGVFHKRKHYPRQLSGGQQQRVALARAIVSDPALILADEPTGNLDSANGAEVMHILEKINESGTTIVMVTHSHDDALSANRIVQLFDGQIISESVN